MLLHSIRIKNYRSIEDISIVIRPLPDGSYTYGLIGVNEAGKSSILKALALKDDLIDLETKDYKDKTKDVEVIYNIDLEKSDISIIEARINAEAFAEAKKLAEAGATEVRPSKYVLSEQRIGYVTSYNFETVDARAIRLDDASIYLLEPFADIVFNYVHENMMEAIFWIAEDKYLISKPIDLKVFAANPEKVSIPLKNCFKLAGYDDVQKAIDGISESTDKEHLQTKLGKKVTEHIKAVWPNHPIKITFYISDGLINFHVKDDKTSGKAKTADQRSDGFKQFVSFLLTVSAENKNKVLNNTILLLDEPETHLHPQAQEFLLQELVNLTKNVNRNISFFATHSLFMIDKGYLSRNYRISKERESTEIDQLDPNHSSYSSVSFEVFGIPTNDYHNELYGCIQDRMDIDSLKEFDSKLDGLHGLKKDVNYTKVKGQKTDKYVVTLPTLIRNVIHHPENDKNSFTPKQLRQSIETLKKIKEDLN